MPLDMISFGIIGCNFLILVINMIGLKMLKISIIGELYKYLYKVGLIKPKLEPINTVEKRDEPVVVSLTSYGRRVSKIVSTTIVSLMRQSYRPDCIVLWLDNDNWNKENLPLQLKRLMEMGLTIRFTNDLKSYTKLIPELLSPTVSKNELVVTVDDDQYYHTDFLRLLIEAYKADPSKIHTHRAHEIRFDEKGDLKPYNEWKMNQSNKTGHLLLPTGCAGCVYNQRILHKDVIHEELFMKLCPKADDVWFFFMEWRAGTEINVLPQTIQAYYPTDMFYQHIHSGSSLMSTNCGEGQNDVQVRNVMNHYGITSDELRSRC